MNYVELQELGLLNNVISKTNAMGLFDVVYEGFAVILYKTGTEVYEMII